jgi:hypothetical protein
MTDYAHASATLPNLEYKRRIVRRLTVWGICILTYCITLALMRAIKVATGLDPFSVVLKGFIPVGAVCVAALAISGFVLGAHLFKLPADRWDLLFLMACCVLLQFIIVAVDYWLLLQAHSELAGRLSYGRYFSLALTTPEYVFTSSSYGTSRPQAIGESGWILLLPRLGCLLGVAKLAHTKFEADANYSV